MNDALQRLEVLMGDTLQILDHMKVDAEYQAVLSNIVNGLQEQQRNIEELRQAQNQQLTYEAAAISANLNQINQLVQQLESDLRDDYETSAQNNIEQYEQLELSEQMEQTETYHDKIDYLSAVKIRENLYRMNEVLLLLRS